MNGQLDALTRDNIDTWIRESTQSVFVDVWGPECQPCLQLEPSYASLAGRFGDQARFLKLEAPRNRMACVDLEVMSLPTFLHFVDGQEESRLAGQEITRSDLIDWVGSKLE